MRIYFLVGNLLFAISVFAQETESKSIGLGLKFGYNFSNVNSSSSFNTSNTNGYHVGAFYSPGSQRKSGFGYRTEIIYSKQGYDFAKGNTTGTVKLDYVLLPQLTTFNISRLVQLQFGLQMAFLVNGKADSSVSSPMTNPYGAAGIMDYYNKIDYGFAGGIEFQPFKGLLVGARLNISLSNANKDQSGINLFPSFIPDISSGNIRNNVLQVFAGWKF